MPDTVGVERPPQLVQGPRLGPRGDVVRVRGVGEPSRVEDVRVAVDQRFLHPAPSSTSILAADGEAWTDSRPAEKAAGVVEGSGTGFWSMLWWAVLQDVPSALHRVDSPVMLAQGALAVVGAGQTPRYLALIPGPASSCCPGTGMRRSRMPRTRSLLWSARPPGGQRSSRRPRRASRSKQGCDRTPRYHRQLVANPIPPPTGVPASDY